MVFALLRSRQSLTRRVMYNLCDTTGFLDPSSDLDEGLYPWGAAHVGILAPRLTKLIMPFAGGPMK